MHKLTKNEQLKLVNLFVGGHDLLCECEKPAVHSLNILLHQLKEELTTEDKEYIKKCLGSTTTEDTAADAGLTGEELEKLFSEDGDDETG